MQIKNISMKAPERTGGKGRSLALPDVCSRLMEPNKSGPDGLTTLKEKARSGLAASLLKGGSNEKYIVSAVCTVLVCFYGLMIRPEP